MKINNFNASVGNTFIIAEIGNNHNGSYELAVEMIDQAISAGANCVNFKCEHLRRSIENGQLMAQEKI